MCLLADVGGWFREEEEWRCGVEGGRICSLVTGAGNVCTCFAHVHVCVRVCAQFGVCIVCLYICTNV